MGREIERLHSTFRRLFAFLLRHKYDVVALLLILLWCLPYFTSGNRVEWGDFGLFAQGYEAVRQSIIEYGQFPWFNPWIAGGVPLYGNPQIGVFSLQTFTVLLFGASVGLKIAVVIYTLAGYAAMRLLLKKIFKADDRIGVLLSLIWIFSTFFVAHIPSHFTFVWYMLAPLYVYLALTLKHWRGGVLLGGAFGIMALSAVHNPFFHLSFVVGIILLIRFVITKERRDFCIGLGTAALTFLTLAGHRLFFTAQNVLDFPRELSDPAASFSMSMLGVFLPLSTMNREPYDFSIPSTIEAPYGFGETSSSIGILAVIAAAVCIAVIAYSLFRQKGARKKVRLIQTKWRTSLLLLSLALLFFVFGLGNIHPLAPYNLLDYLPVFGEMRVSSRWFLGLSFCLLLFIAATYLQTKDATSKKIILALLFLGVLELFLLNWGYQHNFFKYKVTQPDVTSSSLTFRQTELFGSVSQLPDGTKISVKKPRFFREYEATLFNTGVVSANDAFLYRLDPETTPLCVKKQCGLVLSDNATVQYWSPQKIVLQRTDDGPIRLNMNDSNYFLVNGVRNNTLRVAEPFKEFVISAPDATITIEAKPTIFK